MGTVNVNVIPSNLRVDGDLLEFNDVNANLTTAVNGDLLRDVKVGTTIGGTDLPVGVRAAVEGGERPVRLETLVGGKEQPVRLEGRAEINGTILDKVNATMGLSASIKELAPFLLTLLWTDIPIVKLRVPHDYTFGFSFFGFEFFALHFRGESKAVTAKNPNGAAGTVDV